ncbi:hypothetical protein K9M42_02825 [Patescibacteria group bacterium]|nr:hypothetical protein [Patescibacteria group bacterium]
MENKVKRFEEIMQKMLKLNDEALEICDEITRSEENESLLNIGGNAYHQWYAYIKGSINKKESGFEKGAGVGVDMIDSFKKLKLINKIATSPKTSKILK